MNMVWSDVSAEIAVDKVIRASTHQKIFDNFEAMANGDPTVPLTNLVLLENQRTNVSDTTHVLQPIGANQVAWGPLSVGAIVGQNEMKTASGSVSTSSESFVDLVLPGGQYGLYPQITDSGAGQSVAQIADGVSAGYTTWIALKHTAGNFAGARQRYITASPPYNLGNGDIPLFIFVHMRGGKILSTYVAEAPPWAYNGPTDIRGIPVRTLEKPKRGRLPRLRIAYKQRLVHRPYTFADVKAGRISPQEFEDQPVTEELVDIDHDFKNADMDLIPHPFAKVQRDDQVVLLDPIHTDRLQHLHCCGEDIAEMLHGRYLRIDNEPLDAMTPKGVRAHKYRWK